MQEIVRIKLVEIRDSSDGFEAGARPVQVGDNNRAVQCHYGRMIHLNQLIIEEEDLFPICCFVLARGAMARGNACLQMIFADLLARCRLRQVKHAPGHHGLIPAFRS